MPLAGVLPISLQMLGQHVLALPLTKQAHTIHVDQDKTIQAWRFAVKCASILLLIITIADHAVMQQAPVKPVAAEALSLSLPTQTTVELVETRQVPASLVAVEALSILPLIEPIVVHVVQHVQRRTHAAAANARQQIVKG
jgi:hypothetical protein